MRRTFLLITLLQFTVSCASLQKVQDENELLAYLPQTEEQTLLTRHLPVFIIEKQNKPYNKIGTPKAQFSEDGTERVYVDAQEATIYTEKRKFITSSNTYTNIIYRIHFSETPYSLFPFHIGAGKNVGLIVIVTLNKANKPVLYSTVHTCGCFLAFIPTTYLPNDAFPPRWPEKKQVIYTEILPSVLDPKDKTIKNPTLMVLIRDASHRIKNIWLSDQSARKSYATTAAQVQPLALLERLPLNGSDQTTSFYETSGKRIGYVKDSHKPFERLFISWWALDWRIGEDKKLSTDKGIPPIFFTSLKPWARNASDLRDFPTLISLESYTELRCINTSFH